MRWKAIKGSPYAVSDTGLVRNTNTGRLKRSRLDSDGYAILDLHNNGVRVTAKVHRLVARAFIPNPKRKPQVSHKDHVRNNNAISNLKWATSKENINHSVKAGHFWYGPTRRPIVTKKRGGTTQAFHSIKAAERAGYHRNSIYLCLNGEQKHHRGRTWSYLYG